MLSRIRALAGGGFGIVLSTHGPDHALMVATRVAVIADGGLRAIGPPAEVVTPATLSAIYRTPRPGRRDPIRAPCVHSRLGGGRKTGHAMIATLCLANLG